MKTKIFQMALAAMLLLEGCSKDELINKAIENNQSLKSGKPDTSTEIVFECASILNSNFIELAPGYLYPIRKILKQGNFTGTINGFGVINSKNSRYEITNYEILPHDGFWYYTDRYVYLQYPEEEKMYKIILDGVITTGSLDYCNIQIVGNIYPVCYVPLTSSEVGQFEGTAITYSGNKKLVGLNGKKFRVWGRTFTSGINNFDNGKVRLNITDNLEIR